MHIIKIIVILYKYVDNFSCQVYIMDYVDSVLHSPLDHANSLLDISESIRTQLITDEELDDDNKELFELIRYLHTVTIFTDKEL